MENWTSGEREKPYGWGEETAAEERAARRENKSKGQYELGGGGGAL